MEEKLGKMGAPGASGPERTSSLTTRQSFYFCPNLSAAAANVLIVPVKYGIWEELNFYLIGGLWRSY